MSTAKRHSWWTPTVIFGLRFPLVQRVTDEVAIDGYIELVPSFSIFPSTEIDRIGGIGCRAYFRG